MAGKGGHLARVQVLERQVALEVPRRLGPAVERHAEIVQLQPERQIAVLPSAIRDFDLASAEIEHHGIPEELHPLRRAMVLGAGGDAQGGIARLVLLDVDGLGDLFRVIEPADELELDDILGHEGIGEIVEVGGDVHNLVPGDFVVPMVRRPCPHPAYRDPLSELYHAPGATPWRARDTGPPLAGHPRHLRCPPRYGLVLVPIGPIALGAAMRSAPAFWRRGGLSIGLGVVGVLAAPILLAGPSLPSVP